MEKILISACLLGEKTRYDGCSNRLCHPFIREWHEAGRLISVCPEVEGGLGVPRPPAEIVSGTAAGVLAGETGIVNRLGEDVKHHFIAGARIALHRARESGIKTALFKEKSPSCGVHRVYDGRFCGRLVAGAGITTALLQQNGIRVFSEQELKAVASL